MLIQDSRWLLFLVFSAVALAVVPTVLVGLAFAGWLAWIVRDLRRTMGGLEVQEELVADP